MRVELPPGVRAVAVLAMLSWPTADASPRVVASAGAGPVLGYYEPDYLYYENRRQWGVGLEVDVGMQLTGMIEVGVHTGYSTVKLHEEPYCNGVHGDPSLTCYPGEAEYFFQLPLGVFARITLLDRFWFAPWAGLMHEQFPEGTPNQEWRPAYGLQLGGDIAIVERRHRIGAYASVARSSGVGTYHDDPESDTYFALGVAYRFR